MLAGTWAERSRRSGEGQGIGLGAVSSWRKEVPHGVGQHCQDAWWWREERIGWGRGDMTKFGGGHRNWPLASRAVSRERVWNCSLTWGIHWPSWDPRPLFWLQISMLSGDGLRHPHAVTPLPHACWAAPLPPARPSSVAALGDRSPVSCSPLGFGVGSPFIHSSIVSQHCCQEPGLSSGHRGHHPWAAGPATPWTVSPHCTPPSGSSGQAAWLLRH